MRGRIQSTNSGRRGRASAGFSLHSLLPARGYAVADPRSRDLHAAELRKVIVPAVDRGGSWSPCTGRSGDLCAVSPLRRPQRPHVLALVIRKVLAAVDGVGAGAVPAQAAARFALHGDLIRHPSAVHLPQQGAALRPRVGAAVGQAEAVRAVRALPRRPRQVGVQDGRSVGRRSAVDVMVHFSPVPLPSFFYCTRAARPSQVGRAAAAVLTPFAVRARLPPRSLRRIVPEPPRTRGAAPFFPGAFPLVRRGASLPRRQPGAK